LIIALRSVALIANAQTRFLMVDLAREIQRRHGSQIHLYCANVQERAFYVSQNTDNVFDSINLYEPLHDAALRSVSDPHAEIETARAYETRLGRSYNSLAVGNRHLGRGYALAGYYHPRSRHSERSTYIQMLGAYNRYFAFWECEVAEKCLSLMLGGPLEAANAARLNGLPYRRLAESRYANLHFWAHNEFNENPTIRDAYERVADSHAPVPVIQEAYKSVGTLNRQYRQDNNFLGLSKNLITLGARRLYWCLRGYEKRKGYYGADEFRLLIRRWHHGRKMSASKLCRLDDLTGIPFIFFPLATEPETALQQLSPEFFFQHAAIAALSRDLPAGVRLVVKESIMAVGRRPDNFYDQIGELKNVIWMNMLEPGFEVARRATAVAVITGSSGFEAAVMGTPVISFGAHNGYNILPHVFHVTDLARASEAIRQIFDNGVTPSVAKHAGGSYLQAIIDTSFDLGEYDYSDLKKYDLSVVRRACDALENSLGIGDRKAGRIAKTG
jgi:hypothetical protein